MSEDRRPEKLYVHRDDRVCQLTREASNDEVLAVVRRGVESGTIKGEVVRAVEVCTHGPMLYVEPGQYIVIGPVSDGGSET